MACLDRDGILRCKDLAVEKVDLSGREAHVYVRVMTGAERDQFEIFMQTAQQHHGGFVPNIRAAMAVYTLCDAQGGRLFGVSEMDALGELDSLVLDAIFDVARRLNRMTRAEVAALTKNSGTTPDDSSGTGSPDF